MVEKAFDGTTLAVDEDSAKIYEPVDELISA